MGQVRTSYRLADLNNLSKRYSIPSNTTNLRPLALRIDGLSDYSGNIRRRSQCHDSVLMSVHHESTAVLEVEWSLQRLDMLCCLVRESKIVQEQPRLEQGVFQNLRECKHCSRQASQLIPQLRTSASSLTFLKYCLVHSFPAHHGMWIVPALLIHQLQPARPIYSIYDLAYSLGAKRFTPAVMAASMRAL